MIRMKPSFILRFARSNSWLLVAVLTIVSTLDPLPTQVQCFSSSRSNGSSRTALIFSLSSSRRSSRSTARNTAILRMAPQPPQPLASERDWSAYFDKATGLIYYFNGKTGESLWTPPTKTFPTVDPATILSLQQQDKANALTDSVDFVTNVFKKIEDAGTKTFTTVKKLEEVAVVMRNYNINNNNNNSNNKNTINTTTISTTTATLSQQVEITPSSTASVEQSTTTTTATTTTKFTFANIFASAIQKQQQTKKFKTTEALPKSKFSNITNFDIATLILPSPDKVTWGGEDATFVLDRTFGVFDGVSGATKEDGLPLYSKTLADQILKNLSSFGSIPETATTARGLSFSELGRLLLLASTYANENATGASTAILGSIGDDSVLRIINLGDSAAWVVRDGAVVARTKEISHYFDCPYQLAVDSPDRPRDCTKLQLELLPQDIVLMASDGIFDNLSESAICKVLASVGNVVSSSSSLSSSPAARIAKTLVDESRRVSLDISADTPYAKLAKKNRYNNYKSGLGGKVDDISCVLVVCS
jgi:protein phosphatase PTC7